MYLLHDIYFKTTQFIADYKINKDLKNNFSICVSVNLTQNQIQNFSY